MKLQRSTVILIAAALLLGGGVLISELYRGQQSSSVAEGDAVPVYDFEEDAVVGLHIETQSLAVTFTRDEGGIWQMTDPDVHPAEAAAIAFLLSRLTTDGLLQTTTIDAANQAEFGLDVPFATLDITLQDGTSHQLVLGDADFSGQNSYALIDPVSVPLPETAGETTVALVSEDVLNGIDRPLEEWKTTVEGDGDADNSSTPPDADTDTDTSDTASPDIPEETPGEGELSPIPLPDGTEPPQ